MAKKSECVDTAILEELSAIKRLLIYALIRSGANQGEIGQALGVNQSSVSRMFKNEGKGRPKRGAAKGAKS